MKQHFLFVAVSCLFLGSVGCNESTNGDTDSEDSSTVSTTRAGSDGVAPGTSASGNYIDLKTGKTVRRNEASGRYVDDAGSPVDFYVDINASDTFYGETGVRVNNAIMRDGDVWRVDETKIKLDGDETKIKEGDSKIKVEGDEAKLKVQ